MMNRTKLAYLLAQTKSACDEIAEVMDKNFRRDNSGRFSSSGGGGGGGKRAPINSTGKLINKLTNNSKSNANSSPVSKPSSTPSKPAATAQKPSSPPSKPAATAQKPSSPPSKPASEKKQSGGSQPDWKVRQKERMAARAESLKRQGQN